MAEQLTEHICELYAAIGLSRETRMENLPAVVYQTEKTRTVIQDFRGRDTPDQLRLKLRVLIELVASLENHLCKWAGNHGKNPLKVKAVFAHSRPLQIIHDLFNSNKHGFPGRHGELRSGQAIKYEYVRREMKLKTQAKKGSWVAMTLGPRGEPVIRGDGMALGILTADIVDRNGNKIGDVYDHLGRAVEDCEHLMSDLGIKLGSAA